MNLVLAATETTKKAAVKAADHGSSIHMHDIVTFTLYLCVAAIIIACTAAIFVVAGSWAAPRIKNLTEGQKPVKGLMDCCPPGLGCNDPNSSYKACVRLEARRLANAPELIKLDQTWSDYHAQKEKRFNSKETANTHRDYAVTRDGIIARVIEDAADAINARSIAQLPQHTQDAGEELNGKVDQTSTHGY